MSWEYYKGALVPKQEIHFDIRISKQEANSLLKTSSALFIRYTTDFDQEQNSPAYYVIKDTWEAIDELSANTRYIIRKALRMCDVRKINKEIMIRQGYEVYYTHTVNFKLRKINILKCDQYLKMIENLSDREFFGCFDRQSGKLIGYSQNEIGEGVCYSTTKANPIYYRGYYPFYALFYTMNEYYLQVCKKKYVSDGFRTLDQHSGIQDFLISKFKFRKAYCKLHLHYIWWLKFLVNMIYPFRNIIWSGKIKNLLFQEEISRKSKATKFKFLN